MCSTTVVAANFHDELQSGTDRLVYVFHDMFGCESKARGNKSHRVWRYGEVWAVYAAPCFVTSYHLLNNRNPCIRTAKSMFFKVIIEAVSFHL